MLLNFKKIAPLLIAFAFFCITPKAWPAEKPKKPNSKSTTDKIDKQKSKDKTKERKSAGPKRIKTYEFFEAPDYKDLTAEFFRKITQEMKLLEQIYKKTPPGNERAEVLFRLADVYWLNSKYKHLRAMELYHRRYEKFMKHQTRIKPRMPKLKGGRTLRIYDILIKRYPKYARLDEVLFLAGFHSSEIQYPNYYRYYRKLIKDYPRSKYNIDARMALGEYYFLNRQLKKAIRIYKSVISYGPTKVYYYAIYKLGWCYYNLGDLKRAISLLKTVVRKSSQIETKYAIELRDEALRNLVLFYSDMGKIDEAIAYFESVGHRELSRKVLENLAGVYFEQAKFRASITTYKRLIEFDRLSKDVPFYYSRVVLSYQKRGLEKRARRAMEAYIPRFEEGSAWAKKNKKEDREDAWERAEKYLRYLANSTHKEAQKEKDEAKYIAATKYYRLYLSKFPAHKNAYEMKYLLAEIYYHLKDYASASKYYTECVKDESQSQYRHDAAMNNLQALTFLEEQEFKEISKKLTAEQKKSYEKIPFGTWAPKLLGACDLFIQVFPKDEKVPDTIYQKAKTQYNYNSFDEAMVNLQEVIGKHPKSQVSSFARRMMLDIYGIRKDWDNIVKWATLFLRDKFFATPENKSYLLKLIQDATFKKGLQLAENNENEEAAKIFVRLQRTYPNSKLADKALHNAILNFLIVGNMAQARELFTVLSKKYPSSENVGKSNLAIANSYESRLNYKKAAEYYEIYVKREPKSKKAPDCLYNAALYRETMEQYTQAIANYKKYVSLYPSRKDVPSIHFNIAVIYEKARNYSKAASAFKSYYTRFTENFDKNVEARYRYAQARGKMARGQDRDYRNLIHYYNSRKNRYKKAAGTPSAAARYAAKAELILIDPLYKKFERIKFKMPQSVLKKQIENKAMLLKQLQDRYLNVVKLYGDSETGIEALYQIGLIYQKFGEALFYAPVPKGLSPEALDVYQQELEKQAKPIEEKSVAAYEECLKKAFELNVYNKFTKMTYDKLKQYKPQKYTQIFAKPVLERYEANPINKLNYTRKVSLRKK